MENHKGKNMENRPGTPMEDHMETPAEDHMEIHGEIHAKTHQETHAENRIETAKEDHQETHPATPPEDTSETRAKIPPQDTIATPPATPPATSPDTFKNRYLALKEKSSVFYKKYQKFTPAAVFFGGFVFDVITYYRIDSWLDDLIIFLYLMLTGALIALINLVERKAAIPRIFYKYSKLYLPAVQFCFGSLFSAYVIFYFYSATFATTSIFLVILLAVFVANEFIEHKYSELYVQISIYYMVCASFFIFFIPIVAKRMSYWTFLVGTVIGLFMAALVLVILFRKEIYKPGSVPFKAMTITAAMCAALNLFYVMDWIPPVPIALRTIGVYHKVLKGGGMYELTYAKPPWYRFWSKVDDPFYLRGADRAYCFASVFAPTALKEKVFQHWLYYSEDKGQWALASRIGYDMTGGRDSGFRGYTYKAAVTPGKWRVEIRTEAGRLIGRITFDIQDGRDRDLEFATIKK
jgi:hypothetical protein